LTFGWDEVFGKLLKPLMVVFSPITNTFDEKYLTKEKSEPAKICTNH